MREKSKLLLWKQKTFTKWVEYASRKLIYSLWFSILLILNRFVAFQHVIIGTYKIHCVCVIPFLTPVQNYLIFIISFCWCYPIPIGKKKKWAKCINIWTMIASNETCFFFLLVDELVPVRQMTIYGHSNSKPVETRTNDIQNITNLPKYKK